MTGILLGLRNANGEFLLLGTPAVSGSTGQSGDETAARIATPDVTRRPDLACGGEEIARPVPATGVVTAGLIGRERVAY